MQSCHFSLNSCLSYCQSLKSCLSCFKCSLTMYTICCSSFLPLWSHVGEYTIFIMQQQLEPKLLRSTQNKSHIDKTTHIQNCSTRYHKCCGCHNHQHATILLQHHSPHSSPFELTLFGENIQSNTTTFLACEKEKCMNTISLNIMCVQLFVASH